MKQLVIFLIRFYQVILSSSIKQLLGISRICRYSPSCSQYCKKMIEEKGLIRGGSLGIKRILTCQPFYG